MKRFLLLLPVLLLLCGCVAEEVVEVSTPSTPSVLPEPAEEAPVCLKEPPRLTVTAAGEAIETGPFSGSWHFDEDPSDDLAGGVQIDGPHPMDTVFDQPNLSQLSAEVILDFGPCPPDKITVHAWSTALKGTTDEPWELASEDVAVEGLAFRLADEATVYEVIATWSSYEAFGGGAFYSFQAGNSALLPVE